MALTATIYRFKIALSDVDRGVYETLDLRLARHPSETMRYLVTRTLAYCLSYEAGIVFSKGGISSTDEPPIAIRDATSILTAWIDIGTPSPERLHKAAKAAKRVSVYTHAELPILKKEAQAGNIHRAAEIEIFTIGVDLLAELELKLDRNSQFELVRSDGQLYVTLASATRDGTIEKSSLVSRHEMR